MPQVTLVWRWWFPRTTTYFRPGNFCIQVAKQTFWRGFLHQLRFCDRKPFRERSSLFPHFPGQLRCSFQTLLSFCHLKRREGEDWMWGRMNQNSNCSSVMAKDALRYVFRGAQYIKMIPNQPPKLAEVRSKLPRKCMDWSFLLIWTKWKQHFS